MDTMDLSITLPPDEIFHNFENAMPFAIDIGGSLTKITYYSTVQYEVTNSGNHAAKEAQGKLCEISARKGIPAGLRFIVFQSIDTCLDFIKDHLMNAETNVIQATGGGAQRFKDVIEKKLGLRVEEKDEMLSLIKGCNFVLRNIPNEAFVFDDYADSEFMFQKTRPDVFPYLLVNIGSGASILKVESEDKFELLGGSLITGGTFWGLGKLLTQAKSFDELLQLASKGQCKNVDLLVKDIYGGSYHSYAENIVASSFGKSASTDQEFSKDDLAASLLHMISSDIGQLACLHAKLQNISRIYFGGFFIRGHPSSKRTISNLITFLTKGDVQALFLRHEGYLAVIGASLRRAEDDMHHEADVQRQFCKDIEDMLGHEPNWYWKIMWGGVSPLLLFAVLIFYIVSYIQGGTPTYQAWNKELGQSVITEYPVFGQAMIGLLIVSSVMCVPVTALYVYCTRRRPGVTERT